MKDDTYNIQLSNFFRRFEFVSEGPNGQILKAVSYDDIDEYNYMLGFGDIIDGMVHDNIITDNKDTKKVLNTVGLTLYEFFTVRPGATVYAQGADSVRTRLYRMTIANNLERLENDFHVLGQIGMNWHRFERNWNYERFMIRKKTKLSL